MARFDVRSLPAVWTRELIIFKRYWPGTTFTAILEPLIFLFAIGLGVGAFVDEIDGMKYVVFVGTRCGGYRGVVQFGLPWHVQHLHCPSVSEGVRRDSLDTHNDSGIDGG